MLTISLLKPCCSPSWLFRCVHLFSLSRPQGFSIPVVFPVMCFLFEVSLQDWWALMPPSYSPPPLWCLFFFILFYCSRGIKGSAKITFLLFSNVSSSYVHDLPAAASDRVILTLATYYNSLNSVYQEHWPCPKTTKSESQLGLGPGYVFLKTSWVPFSEQPSSELFHRQNEPNIKILP